ncbi:MAG: hypothetical protein CNLJKLNK_00867 [Holosporales bacterium]
MVLLLECTVLLLIFSVVFLMLTLAWAVYKVKLLQREKCQCSALVALYLKILKNTDLSWCLWNIKENTLDASDTFYTDLNIPAVHVMEDLLAHFKAGPFSPLSKAIEHVYAMGGSFELDLNHQDHEYILYGKSLDDQEIPPRFILVTLKDVTDELIKQANAEKTIRHLRADNNIYQNIINKAPLALWHRNLQGRITHCNTSYTNIVGFSSGRVIAENIPLTQTINHYDIAQQALKLGEMNRIRSHLVVDGKRHLFEIAEIPTSSNASTIGYALDISQIDELENNILKTNQSYKDILNALSSPIAVFDENRVLSFYNLAYKQLFEFSDRLLNTRPTLGDILEDLRKRRKMQEYGNFQMHKKERNDLFNNIISPTEEISYLPDGRTLRIRISPYPLGGILFIFENITNQLDLERDVNTLMAVQKTTLDHLKEGIVVLGNDGKIRLINPAVFTIWNLPQKTIQDTQKWLESLENMFLDKPLHQHWIGQIANCFAKRHALMERIYLKEDKVIDWSYVPLPDGSHMLAFADASDEWLHEQKLKAKNLNLEMNQRLKHDYLERIRHDMQVPLKDIIGFSSTLSSQVFGTLNEKQFDYCVQIQKNAQTVKNLFETAIESVHLDHGNINLNVQSVDIQHFIDQFESYSLKMASDYGATLVLQKNIHVDAFDFDEKRMQQALFGLLSYYMKNVIQGDEILIDIQSQQDAFYIQFTKENFTTSSNFGKKIAKLIVEAHHGTFKESFEKGKCVCQMTIFS